MNNQDIMALAASLAASLVDPKRQSLPSLRNRLKAEFPTDLYRQMIVYQRSRHNTDESERWQGRDEYASAETQYPNILAELDASGWWMDRIAMYAEVSPAIMAAVMEDNGELSFREMQGLAKCFGCRVDYLAAPILSTVDPSTNKGKARRRHLKDLLERAAGIDSYFVDTVSRPVLATLEKGQIITYALFRWARYYVQDALNTRARMEATQQRTRTGHLSQGDRSSGADLHTKIEQARERQAMRKCERRLSEIRAYVDNAMLSSCYGTITTKDLASLANFSRWDLYGALGLAIRYGEAIGVHLKPSH